MNLYYKVEAAFDGMADALKAAMNVADNSEETELYSDLADECIGLRDKAHRDLTNLIIKKAAPAVSATEAAKKNISDSIIDDILDDVKNSRFTIMKVNRSCTDLCIILHTNSESERDYIAKSLFDIVERIVEIYNLGKQDDRKEADA
ncbi:hypothetical protein [Hominenteromicrobium sp.]|uniref:hypothetical protein n=1 Tax=Hominenteromicrobium sp. TaxID=3073581 RepID=UPI003AB82785